MASNFIPIEQFRNKFYQKEVNSKKFLQLSEEDLSELSKRVYRRQEIMSNTIAQNQKSMSNLEKYQKTLQYLTAPSTYFELKTFDERIAFLIMMTDPSLVTFKEFLKIDLINTEEIDKAKNNKEKNFLKQLRNQAISAYKSTVIEKIGFFDIKLIQYEELFFKRFFNEKELITEIRSNIQDKFMSKAKLLKDFNSISDERYDELVNIAQTWLSLVPEKYNFKVAIYSVTNQKELLGLTNSSEQLALFILLIDSNLDILKIYEEESIMKNIEKRIIEEFGYFNNELINLEKKFYNRFCPKKNLSVWSKTKKH